MTDSPCVLCCHHGNEHERPCGQCETAHPCGYCVGQSRRNLIGVEQLAALGTAELAARGAAATPPDPSGTRARSDGLPDLLVLIGPGSTGWHSDPIDIDSVIGVLQRWDRDWRITFREPAADTPASITRCTLYLLRRLQKAADEIEPLTFAEFDQDIHIMHEWLRRALKDGAQRTPVPCLTCGRRTLERPVPREDGRVFEWHCAHCHRNYTTEEFWIAVRNYGQAV